MTAGDSDYTVGRGASSGRSRRRAVHRNSWESFPWCREKSREEKNLARRDAEPQRRIELVQGKSREEKNLAEMRREHRPPKPVIPAQAET
jgi:hypothetical protein